MPISKTEIQILLLILTYSECARILVINPTPSYSHQIVIRPIVRGLAKKGHDLVFVTPRPMNDEALTNVREIDLSFATNIWQEGASKKSPDLFQMIFKLTESLLTTSKAQMTHPEVQDLIKNNTEHFDIVIIEYYIPVWYAFKARFNCPFISFVSVEAINKHNELLGNAYHPILYPDSVLGKPINERFPQRLINYFMGALMNFYIDYYLNPASNKVIADNFGGGYPDVAVLASEVDMLFTNTNPVIGTIRPLSLSTISIGGGIHIRETQKLSKPLKEYMDKSTRGVVYVSFGSNVNTAQLPATLQQMFFGAFAKLPYDVLWKYESEDAPNKPDNVKLMKWVPQQDLLRHKNVKVFITHAGLQSSEEGLIFRVPMLAIPFFADQPYNAYQIASKGIGIMIDQLETLTSEELESAILELAHNKTYNKNLNRLADIVADEPMTPLEKAVWWTEYVLRHKGAKHLKGPIVSFHQHYLLDIFGFLFLIGLLLLFVTYKLLKFSIIKLKNTLVLPKLKQL